MRCGPVLIQWLLASGFCAYGSVLLASVPPSSMYIRPSLPVGGGLCAIQAFAHSIAFASMHIGSGPGVVGLSGMQVNALLPLRRVRMVPSAFATTTVAILATCVGAARIALAIICASLGAGLSAACTLPMAANSAATTVSWLFKPVVCMATSHS